MFAGRIVSIVDDDKSIRDGLSSLLRSRGVKAYAFASAMEFLKSRRSEDSDCLIVDVKMPKMGGLELQDELTRRGVAIPVIFISAYDSRRVTARVKSGRAVAFLEKPFDAQAIERSLKGVFDSDE